MRPRLSLPDLDFLRMNAPWLAAGALLMLSSSFGQTFFISVFAGEIRAEFGLTDGQWGAIYSLATAASALAMVWVGGLTDRFRARTLGAAVLFGLAMAALAMSVVSALWALVVVIVLLRFFGQGMCGQVAMVAMARWFVASRGRALAVATLGVATGEALLPLGFVALKGYFDWRTLWVIGSVALLMLIPALLFLLQRERTPQSHAADDHSGAGMAGRSWRRAEVLRHWLFWCMVPATLGPAAFSTAFFFHQVHFAASKGWEHVSLVALFPLFSMANVTAMLVSGLLIDRMGSGRLAGVYLLPIAGGYVLLALAGTLPLAAVGMALAGTTVGMAATINGAFWAEYFGTRHLGEIRAATMALMVLGTALGPGISGVLIDLGLDLADQLYGIALIFVAAAGLATLGVRRARPLLSAPSEIDVKRP